MQKFKILFLSLILCSCTLPNFHEKTQWINFKYPDNVVFTIEGYKNPKDQITVERSFTALKGTIVKEGFETKEMEIKSHFTDDKWARAGAFMAGWEESAIYLLPLTNTLRCTYLGARAGLTDRDFHGFPEALLIPFYTVLTTAAGFTIGFGIDVWNLATLAFPRAVLGNPWYEYDHYIDLSREILTPTQEFEKKCHAKKNTFIGNNNCLPCLIEKVVISTEDECNRCSNREWKNKDCRLKQ